MACRSTGAEGPAEPDATGHTGATVVSETATHTGSTASATGSTAASSGATGESGHTGATADSGGPMPTGPSLVYITWDTTRRDHLSPWGGDPAWTPNLARLAEGAQVYDDAQAHSSWTKPSMASVFTSQPAWEHGVHDWPDAIDVSVPTLWTELDHAGYAMRAAVAHTALAPLQAPYAESFDVFDLSSWEGLGYPGDLITSELLTDAALAQLDALEAGDRPFVLWVHYFDPHDEYFDHDDVIDLGVDPAQRYAEEIAFTDQQLGRLLDRVLDRPDTLTVFHADHGEELGEHDGRFGHAKNLWQPLVDVGLMFRGPGVTPGRVVEPVSLLDVAPTVLELLSVERPATFRGVSLLPTPTVRPRFADVRRFGDWRSVRDGSLKLLWNVGEGSVALYDLAQDPGEQLDLSVVLPSEAARLKALLVAEYPELGSSTGDTGR